MHTTLFRTTLAVAIAAALVAACDRQATTEAQRSAERAGQKIEHALDRTGKKLAEAGEKTQQKLAEAGDRMAASVKEAVEPNGKTTTTVTTGPSTSVTGLPADTRGAMRDTAITASIKTDLLKDPDLSVLKIDVDTRDGVVTLNGLADNEAARGRAEKIAGAIKGVREVHNHLTVKRG